MEAGDLIIQLVMKKHSTFTRRGADLFMKKTITLLDALTGAKFIVKHPDGSKVKIVSEAGTVIKPGSKMTAEGKGMPFYKKSYESGNLFIEFDVKFPENLQDKQVQEVA